MKRIIYSSVIIAFIASVTVSCVQKGSQQLLAGQWRGEFNTGERTIPFNFEVKELAGGTPQVYLVNGAEKALLDRVVYERDSVTIPIELYDAVLIAKIDNDSINGFLRKNQGAKQGLAFKAARNQDYRFKVSVQQATKNIAGKWTVTLTSERDGKPNARETIGLFEQQGTNVTGTILTTTGDYRYLAGVLDDSTLKLSAFSGSNPVYIEADFLDDNTVEGEFISPGGSVKLRGVRNDTASLPDPYALTYLKKDADKFSFSFPDLQSGKPVTLEDDKYKDKVVVVTITGSWCPNCIDEAAFLAPWYKENKARGVEVIGLTFERKDDIDFARTRVSKLINRFDIEYDVLFAGLANKDNASEKLPALNAVLSFPTTLFIDKQGKVRKIHTGYTGPATGTYYTEFVNEFNKTVTALLEEHQTI